MYCRRWAVQNYQHSVAKKGRTTMRKGMFTMVAGVLYAAAAGTAGAQDAGRGQPFWVGNHSWASAQAFMDSGARCATRPLSDAAQAEVEAKIAPFMAQRSGGPAVVVVR
jgi:hypothetical protein